MLFDRLSLVLLVVLAAARLMPDNAPLMNIFAAMFLVRVTMAMRHTSGLQTRLLPVATKAHQIPLPLSDAA